MTLPVVQADIAQPVCHVWHTEGMGLSGILAWMWRLRDSFQKEMGIGVRLVDLRLTPYQFAQVNGNPGDFYDESLATPMEFLAFLKRERRAVHLVNHAFQYVDMLLQHKPDLLQRLNLVGICHTDQDYYYLNIQRFEPYFKKIIAVSPECAAELKRRMPNSAHKVEMLPAWVLPVREACGRPDYHARPLKLIYTGRVLQHQKRVFDLVQLAWELFRLGVQAELTIAGDGPDLAALKDAFEKVPDKIPVHFEPVRPPWEMEPLLVKHQIFVQVSEFEGASVSLMEAMLCRLVPVVTKTRSGHQLLRDGENALTAGVGEMVTLAEHIRVLSLDQKRTQNLAEAAHLTAASYLTALEYPKNFERVIRSCI